ncbi:MAG: right-handed parallel beta-helix repeat-containing protein [Planctomycetes bacterium]|nr:right-handed parallel beta-helix repeat-containing protein [Planctomycetota bacterium]
MITRFVFAIALVTTASGRAADVVVQKNGLFPTIQAGIDAAGPGGTVTVLAGVYEETPIVASSHVGLTLKASGSVIIDARLANGDADGTGLIVGADDVVVRGFTVRHAKNTLSGDPGAGVLVQGVRVRLEKLRVVNASSSAVHVTQTDAVIQNCRFEACSLGVFAQFGSRLRVQNCVIDACSGTGIYAAGDDIVLRKNAITSSIKGIDVTGMRPRVEFNSIRRTEAEAILALGVVDATVRGNKVTSVFSGPGIVMFGDNSNVTSNKIADTRNTGIYTHGSNVVVANNRILGVGSIAEGIVVEGNNSTIEANVLRDVGGNGILGALTDSTVKKNVVLRCGRSGNGASAFYFAGTSVVVLGNTAKDGFGDGFRLSLEQASVSGNSAIRNAIDGFELSVLGTVSKNFAIKNSGEGFVLKSPDTLFTNNVAKNNRIDIAATAMPQSFQANAYGTGGLSTLPEID